MQLKSFYESIKVYSQELNKFAMHGDFSLFFIHLFKEILTVSIIFLGGKSIQNMVLKINQNTAYAYIFCLYLSNLFTAKCVKNVLVLVENIRKI